jgi:hypothetical protein
MFAFGRFGNELAAQQRGRLTSFAAISARRPCATMGNRPVSQSVLLLVSAAYEARGDQKTPTASRRRVLDAFRTLACQLTRRGIVRTLAIEQS